ncbi:MAG: hypothetical protein AD742_09340 [Methylibium sp. NZG]|nr:MAG: hypothetical protein AD742_09340 [Methylibium sp. NZG]
MERQTREALGRANEYSRSQKRKDDRASTFKKGFLAAAAPIVLIGLFLMRRRSLRSAICFCFPMMGVALLVFLA